MAHKWVYAFEEGDASMRNLLGGKGCNLAEMTRIGLPVPPGFTVTTEASIDYMNTGKFPEGMWDQVVEFMHDLNEKTGKEFGNDQNPLLVSIRSGARESMPGMMDTILNVGLTPGAVETMGKKFGDTRFAWDLYRRLIQMFSKVVLDVPGEEFEKIIEEEKVALGIESDAEMTAEGWQKVADRFKKLAVSHTGKPFPEDPYKQLELGIEAVFQSWNGKRAIDYRNHYGYPHTWGTAANIVTMVYGNFADGNSGTGVAFTRNPATGEKKFYGEYLLNAQGEDVVSGARTPTEVTGLKDEIPQAWDDLMKVAETLEAHYRETQDIEFTVEHGKLWMLQTRSGKRTAASALKIASDMVDEGLITKEEAVARISPDMIDQMLHPRFDEVRAEEGDRSGEGSERLARCSRWQGLLRRGRRRSEDQRRRSGDPGPPADRAERRAWYAGRQGYSDVRRWRDQPRGCRCAPVGQARRGGLLGSADQPGREILRGQRQHRA